MSFGVVGPLSPRMYCIDRVLISPQQGAVLGVNMGQPITINGEFVVLLYEKV